ncbi:MAG: hypothetical protein K1X83_04975 [Oligoflexia bacterium]|nr:hypothetical protein [Oligoflexia bacterium]
MKAVSAREPSGTPPLALNDVAPQTNALTGSIAELTELARSGEPGAHDLLATVASDLSRITSGIRARMRFSLTDPAIAEAFGDVRSGLRYLRNGEAPPTEVDLTHKEVIARIGTSEWRASNPDLRAKLRPLTAISSDGSRLLVASGARITVYDLSDQALAKSTQLPTLAELSIAQPLYRHIPLVVKPLEVKAIAFAPDNKQIYCIVGPAYRGHGHRIYDYKDSRSLRVLELHETGTATKLTEIRQNRDLLWRSATCLGFDPALNLLALGTRDGDLHFFRWAAGGLNHLFKTAPRMLDYRQGGGLYHIAMQGGRILLADYRDSMGMFVVDPVSHVLTEARAATVVANLSTQCVFSLALPENGRGGILIGKTEAHN